MAARLDPERGQVRPPGRSVAAWRGVSADRFAVYGLPVTVEDGVAANFDLDARMRMPEHGSAVPNLIVDPARIEHQRDGARGSLGIVAMPRLQFELGNSHPPGMQHSNQFVG